MRSLFYPAYKKLTIEELPVPEINTDEVLIKVAACGICGSELESFATQSERRKPPRIMGHEFSGVIVKAGSEVKNFEEGMHVVSNSVVFCGSCTHCRRGETNLCINRQVFGMHRNGAFAEYVNVPARCLIPMHDKVDFKAACLSEPLANGVHIVALTRHLPIRHVLIFGAGPIGLMVQQAFQALSDTDIIVSDIKAERLAIAKKLGAKHIINTTTQNIEEAVTAITAGEGLDLVVDAVGMETTNSLGLKMLRPGGALVMIGLHANSKPFYSYDIILAEKKIIGTYAATQEDMKAALALIADHKADVSSWVDYYPLSDGVEAFTGLLSPNNKRIKTVIVF